VPVDCPAGVFRSYFMKIVFVILKILGALFVFLMLLIIYDDLNQQKTAIQKIEKTITEIEKETTEKSAISRRDRIIIDELLRNLYAREIALADVLIAKLEDY
jgi:hypothetical protein